MWKKLLITGCVTFSLLSGGTLSAQPSCEIKEEVTSEQLDRTQKELVAMMKELKNDSYFQTELDKAAVQSSLSKRMAAYKDLTVRLLSVLEIQAEPSISMCGLLMKNPTSEKMTGSSMTAGLGLSAITDRA